MAPGEPADLHERRLRQYVEPGDERRGHHLGGNEQQRRQENLTLGDEKEGEKFERQEERGGQDKDDQGGIRRQPGDGGLDDGPGTPPSQPADQVRQLSPAPFLEDDDEGNENLNRTAQQRPDNAPAGNEQRHEEAPSPSGKNGRALRKPVELLQDLLPRHCIIV